MPLQKTSGGSLLKLSNGNLMNACCCGSTPPATCPLNWLDIYATSYTVTVGGTGRWEEYDGANCTGNIILWHEWRMANSPTFVVDIVDPEMYCVWYAGNLEIEERSWVTGDPPDPAWIYSSGGDCQLVLDPSAAWITFGSIRSYKLTGSTPVGSYGGIACNFWNNFTYYANLTVS